LHGAFRCVQVIAEPLLQVAPHASGLNSLGALHGPDAVFRASGWDGRPSSSSQNSSVGSFSRAVLGFSSRGLKMPSLRPFE
jgi:hypothetical protein